MTVYKATINRRYLSSFLILFYELESSRGAEVKIVPDETQSHFDNYEVTIIAKDDTWFSILTHSLNEGLLHHSGWGGIFASQTEEHSKH